jgi:hypothetical protein
LFKYNTDTKEVQHLFNSVTTIVPPSSDSSTYDPVVVLPIKFFNDLDILDNGDIIFTDSSYKYSRSENRQEVLDASPRGRVFIFSQETRKLRTVLCGLHFPNGIQILDIGNRQEFIVTDSTRFRLIKVNLASDFLQGTTSLEYTPVESSAFSVGSTSKAEHFSAFSSCGEYGSFHKMLKFPYEISGVSIFSDSLPGFPDNIRQDTLFVGTEQYDHYYLIGVGTKSIKPFSLLHSLYQWPLFVRDFVGKFIPMKLVEKLVPKYGLIVVVNDQGKVMSSLHDPSGQATAWISQAERNRKTGDLWIGSHSEAEIVVVPAKNLPKQWR